MKLDKNIIFLIDSLGALLTSVMLGVIFPYFQPTIGMPKNALYFLGGIAALFLVYSFSCHILVKKNWRTFLKIIAFANLLYCLVSIFLIARHWSSLTTLGIIYFILEIVVVVLLIIVELKMIFDKNKVDG